MDWDNCDRLGRLRFILINLPAIAAFMGGFRILSWAADWNMAEAGLALRVAQYVVMGLAGLFSLALLPVIMGTIRDRLCDIKFHRRPALVGLFFSFVGAGLYLTRDASFLATAYAFLVLVGPWRGASSGSGST